MTGSAALDHIPGADDAIDADDLLSLIRNYNPNTNEALIRGAFEYGRAMHEGQTRHSGEPYFTHPVAVAAILTEQQLDDATIVTALLHDTIEDTRSTYSEVSERFGAEIAEMVDGVTKLTNLQLSNRESKQAENFRKLFMAMSKDLRVILVKLADRLHNMRTIRHMRPDKQRQKAQETMDIFAPLAGRMGMHWMREELEDLAFRVVNPEARSSILRRFITLQRETGDVIPKITDDIEAVLEKHGVKPDSGEVLVTGANGGVGSYAIAILAKLGYTVVAATGRVAEAQYLKALGASEIIDRHTLSEPGRPLAKERWAGVVDSVGSHTLVNACASTQYGGIVAACGLAQGMDLPGSVAPFILRGVTLAGIDSVMRPIHDRIEAWDRLAKVLPANTLEQVSTEIGSAQVCDTAQRLLDGQVRGRIGVHVNRL